MINRSLFVLLTIVALLWSSPAAADDPLSPHAARVANDVSHQILSPFCPGKTLAMCPSPAAAEVRITIQNMAESGMDEEQIKEAVIEEHGEEFRTIEPPWTDNIGLLGVLGGGLALAFLAVVIISRRRGGGPTDAEVATTQSDSDPEDPYLADLRKQVGD